MTLWKHTGPCVPVGARLANGARGERASAHPALGLASLLPARTARPNLGADFPILPLKTQAIPHNCNQRERQHIYIKLALGWVCLRFVSENGTGSISSAGQSSVCTTQRGLWGKTTWRSTARLLPGNFFLLIFAVCCNPVPPKGNNLLYPMRFISSKEKLLLCWDNREEEPQYPTKAKKTS